MVHQVALRGGSEAALEFWADRLAMRGVLTARRTGNLDFADPEGLGLQLRVAAVGDEPRVARHPDIPEELAIQGFDGVRLEENLIVALSY